MSTLRTPFPQQGTDFSCFLCSSQGMLSNSWACRISIDLKSPPGIVAARCCRRCLVPLRWNVQLGIILPWILNRTMCGERGESVDLRGRAIPSKSAFHMERLGAPSSMSIGAVELIFRIRRRLFPQTSVKMLLGTLVMLLLFGSGTARSRDVDGGADRSTSSRDAMVPFAMRVQGCAKGDELAEYRRQYGLSTLLFSMAQGPIN